MARAAARLQLCRVPERLTPLDASFLHTETERAHMHVAWKGRFEPDPSRPPITLARVRAQVASRLGGAPRFRMRLAFPPGGFAAPVWVDAEGFDLRRHVVALSPRRRGASRGASSTRGPTPRSHARSTARTRCGRSTSPRGSTTGASGS